MESEQQCSDSIMPTITKIQIVNSTLERAWNLRAYRNGSTGTENCVVLFVSTIANPSVIVQSHFIVFFLLNWKTYIAP